MAIAQGKCVEGAHAGLFVKAFGDELKGCAVHGAMGMVEVIIQHGGFKHGHGWMEFGHLRASGAHLDDAALGQINICVFLAKHAVGFHVHFVLAIGEFLEILAKFVHAHGFRLALRLHAGNGDLCGRIGIGGNYQAHAQEQAHGHKQGYNPFHQKSSFGILTLIMNIAQGKQPHQRKPARKIQQVEFSETTLTDYADIVQSLFCKNLKFFHICRLAAMPQIH